MSREWLECVPNVSEGRDGGVVEALVEAATAVPGVFCLGRELDPDHGRAVVTLAGQAPAMETAAFALAVAAVERIDLRGQRGVHRRMGALDVCPFVPLGDSGMDRAVAAAERVGARIGDELGVPVYLYARAARRRERRRLGAVRDRQFEALGALIGGDPAFAPDFGPARLHPTAGACAVGARRYLIAFNVDLDSEDVAVARAVAREVRESSGGLPRVQALGFFLEARRCAQVSMNLLDHEVTSVRAAFDRVVERAAAHGVGVRGGELIGLAPEAAFDEATARHVGLGDFEPEHRIIERRLAAVGLE